LIKTKQKKRLNLVWILANILVVLRYIVDPLFIDCEPCLPGEPCPPSHTDFVRAFWLILIITNVGFIFARYLINLGRKPE
jgi:hypothetical protein